MTFLQRAHPTDPSRCVDFDAYRDPGRGAAGSGSEKAVSLQGCPLAAGGWACRAAEVCSTGLKLAPACPLKARLRHSWVAGLGRVAAEALHLLTCRLWVAVCVPSRL